MDVPGILRRIANRLDGPAKRSILIGLDDRLKAQAPPPHVDARLAALVEEAWAAGGRIDLPAVVYGPAHWNDNTAFSDETFPYYHMLAGLVRSLSCKRIVEVGTHYGGSTLAMLKGMPDAATGQIVTVDITDLNPALRENSRITKLVGDANSEAVIKAVALDMGSAPIDLLYIDAAHDFLPTMINIALYATLLQPRIVVIDDILLNDQMRTLWRALTITHRQNAINCVDVVPDVRAAHVGFGLIELRVGGQT